MVAGGLTLLIPAHQCLTHFAHPSPRPLAQNCYINIPSQCAFNFPMLSNPTGHNVYCQCCQVSGAVSGTARAAR